MTRAAALQPLHLETQTCAMELYELLRALDPARWRDEIEPAVRARLERLEHQLRALLSQIEQLGPSATQLRERLAALLSLLAEFSPREVLDPARLRAEWEQFRVRLSPAYEDLALSLKQLSLKVPSLRPTNYNRNALHVVSGLSVVALIEHVLTPTTMLAVAGAFAATAWSLEIGRRLSPTINQVCMWVFSKVSRIDEAHRINSSTWYTTALLILAITMSPRDCALAVAVLAVADPCAALVGRRFGRLRIYGGRTLEGSLAFVASGALAAGAVAALYHPGPAPAEQLALALGAAACGAIAELFSTALDDNLTIPVAAACGAALAGLALGI